MYAAADLAWVGGTATYGEEVDEQTIPETVRSRWISEEVLVSEEPAPREGA